MKLYSFLLLLILIALLLVSCSESGECHSERMSLNRDWTFLRVDSATHVDEGMIVKGIFPPGAVNVALPHTPRIEPLVVNDQWQGICYYRKTFLLDKKDEEKNIFLKFEGVMNVADVWLNGKHLEKHLGGYLPFVIDITSVAHPDSVNTLVVRLDNRDNPVTGPKPLKELDFNTYGGIYRDVWLIKKAPVYIVDPVCRNKKGSGGVIVTSGNVSENSAEMIIKTHVINTRNKSADIVLKHTLISENGKAVMSGKDGGCINAGCDTIFECKMQLKNPSLWSPDSPILYTLKTGLYDGNFLADCDTTRIGIRDIKITAEGLYLNGKKIFLRGVNRHQEYPYVGYAVPDNAQYRDAYKIKEAGFDYVRASHYPPSPAFLDACDELGIFVLDAIPGWQYFGDSLFVNYMKRSARELIRRDRNHACILGWELSVNETPMPEYFMKEMNAIRTEEDPGTYTAGWIKGKYDIYIEARQHRKEVDRCIPLIVSEYGDWEYYAQNAGFNQNKWNDLLEEERTSRQPRESGEKRMLQQATNIQEAHNDNLTTNAFADGYWVMYDYNRGYANDLEYSGIMDICRLPKFSYYFFKSQRSISDLNVFAKPMIKIASFWTPGISKSVKIFSNCDEVALYLDNRLIGKKTSDKDRFSAFLKHPPFTFDVECEAPGTLTARGYYKGKEVCSDSVSTPGKAYKITLSVDTSGISPRKNDLIFVYARIIDKNGTLVNTASDRVYFKVKGNGSIVDDSPVEALGGIATILLKTGSVAGNVFVEATSGKLIKDVLNVDYK
ncbi:glycoside hydrolase family 2 protein [Coprobacter tertius]|uniref:DUF4982 domain-containing protein n=1 Tax=Coprobacter tertius TaxID=2944915 RepID=A0ABT1MI66_9BACT|nr:glycoside hydrolase family 2 TIM barrel-domain containing protein [Coprobacter tertius]MCP9611739.1 DUF4982 domain-containing protein [Coprobacter tertius]